MTDAKAPEPSIEEILASIRKIISDDEPDSVEAAAPMPVEPEPAIEEDTVLDLTQVMEAAPAEHVNPDAMRPAAPPRPAEPQARVEPENYPEQPPAASSLASDRTVAAASGVLARLAHYEPPPSHGGKSVEDIVRELLNPMLRDWIDQNLTAIVERLVDRELKKISRKAEDS